MKLISLFRYTALIFLICMSGLLFSQPTGGGPGGGGAPIPLGGIEILLAAGGLFGVRKIYKKVKGTKE